MLEPKEDNIERRVTEGNVTAYYYSDFHCKRVVVEIRGLRIGREKINFRYQEGYMVPSDESFYRTLILDYQGIPWRFSCKNGTEVSGIGTEGGTKRVEYVERWAIANEGKFYSSATRLRKAQQIFDYFYNIIRNIPLAQRYINGFDDYLPYLAKKEAKKNKKMLDQGKQY